MTQRIGVGVVTRGRPEGLRRLLGALAVQETGGVSLEVYVVENGEAQGPLEVTDQVPCPVHWLHEPRLGIPFARNRCLDAALESGVQHLLFIDDDEVPAATWSRALVEAARRFGADVVAGPVHPKFGPSIPSWVRAGGFFEPPTRPTGALLDEAWTGNVLIRCAFLAEHPDLRFDERMALTGGSDSELFSRAAERGARIVWCAEAWVEEEIPESRARLGWICRRGFRVAANQAAIERRRRGRFDAALRFAPVATYRAAKGLVCLPVTAFLGPARSVWSLRHLCYAAGLFAGSLGLSYDEYRTTHGR